MILSYRLKKFYVRMVREKRPPEYIARGWAVGMAVGCAVPFGVQLYIAVPLSFLMRCSKLGATLGTLITNPLTIFFIYPAQCWLGSHILRRGMEYEGVVRSLAQVLKEQNWTALCHLSGTLVMSFFVGGFVLAAIFTPITYYAVLSVVRRHRARIEARRLRRLRLFALGSKLLHPRIFKRGDHQRPASSAD